MLRSVASVRTSMRQFVRQSVARVATAAADDACVPRQGQWSVRESMRAAAHAEPVSVEQFEHACTLSRLQPDASQRDAVRAELGRMLAFVRQIQAVDAARECEPCVSVQSSVDRDRAPSADVVDEPVDHETLMNAAANTDDGFYRIEKRVFEKSGSAEN